jgi:hypothetical protein
MENKYLRLKEYGSPGKGRKVTTLDVPYQRHSHFWQRAFSRRSLIKGAAQTSALVLGSGLLVPGIIFGKDNKGPSPKPIPEVIFPGTPFHVLDFNDPQNDISSIYDFKGYAGVTGVMGTGTGQNTNTGETYPLLFDSDMRFMKGTYIGQDGSVQNGTFAFV